MRSQSPIEPASVWSARPGPDDMRGLYRLAAIANRYIASASVSQARAVAARKAATISLNSLGRSRNGKCAPPEAPATRAKREPVM